ncbi:uncharacterized protein [Dermacentor albipictus]|uniref:uncharacterized protein n=1 Tax=Dermacentor albipictus TaxID=60249 RepID=UPI0038FC0C63
MPVNCVTFGCNNYYYGKGNSSFFRSAKMYAKKRALWISAVRRANPDGSLWQPTKPARISGVQFITGRPSKLINHPDYVPKALTYSKTPGEAAVRRHNRCVNRQSDCKRAASTGYGLKKQSSSFESPDTQRTAVREEQYVDAGMECSQHGSKAAEVLLQLQPAINGSEPGPSQMCLKQDDESEATAQKEVALLYKTISLLERRNIKLEGCLDEALSRLLTLSMLEKSAKDCLYYTGLPNYGVFKSLFNYLKPRASKMSYWGWEKRTRSDAPGHPNETFFLSFFIDLFKTMNRLS